MPTDPGNRVILAMNNLILLPGISEDGQDDEFLIFRLARFRPRTVQIELPCPVDSGRNDALYGSLRPFTFDELPGQVDRLNRKLGAIGNTKPSIDAEENHRSERLLSRFE